MSAQQVVVTGAGGFIGSHLCEVLVQRGAHVRALCRYTSRRDVGDLAALAPGVRASIDVRFGDVRDRDFVGDLVTGADAVFHLAASISVPYSFEAPREVVMTNVEGTLNVLQAARRAEVGRMLQMSSSETYGTAQATPISEEHPLGAQSPYAASKVAGDKLAETFHMSYGLPVVIARPFNTYGPRQSQRAVIPTVVAQALAGGELKLGALTPTRDFVFVRDTVAGLIALVDEPATSGATYNIATGIDVCVGDVVRVVGELLGRELVVAGAQAERMRPPASEVHQLLGDATKLRAATGWAPATDLRDGLAQVIAWMSGIDAARRTGAYAI
ncbi:MAG TPA: SDR family NAD(P)-dependent oxidoreductase [Solirubrobacteraceae bacterium]